MFHLRRTMPAIAISSLLSAAAACGGRTLEWDGYTWQGIAMDEGSTSAADAGNRLDAADATRSHDSEAQCRPGRWVLASLVRNARDLGGVPLRDGSSVPCGKWYRGSALSGLAAEGCAAVHDLGIRTVIDLRTSSERDAMPQSACVDEMVRTVWAPLPTPYSVSAADYVTDLTTERSIVAAFDVLGDPAAYPVYMHCVYGRDRTGVLAAVILLALGASESDVLLEYQLTGAAQMSIYPDSLRAALAEIIRRGGVDAYLASMGVSPDRVAALRAQAQ